MHADEMEEGVTMSAGEYQTLTVQRVCRCSWQGGSIPDFLAFLSTFSMLVFLPAGLIHAEVLVLALA